MIGLMPRYIRPGLGADVTSGTAVFGNDLRLAILGFLSEHGPSTTGEIASGIGVITPGSTTVRAALRVLLTEGAITRNPAAGEAVSGARPRYAIDLERVAHLHMVIGQAAGVSPPR